MLLKVDCYSSGKFRAALHCTLQRDFLSPSKVIIRDRDRDRDLRWHPK